ncbi:MULTISPECIES: anhydro-N-acetylmuramic acid kinase [Pontibacter]|uniref:Anhydro-N-acetylmuramic acid kinase n=1 Tax=Pontibacter lucknowensis TaxID=1077936 RepID=A0A1N6VZA1_9BACT|nr:MULTISPECIES: anhydro-N-acetylmuramic acid kinase [Pontibacter]EJF10936.1 anhydro-N-acetylmuramic acid kinase [Pontibacter sp. BAB1700]SIQ83095.1 anhydro-N-acetylmuramic acid kinase [Pontibacter lucknowensis]
MNKMLEQLFKVAGKEKRTIIGLMSGTSLDGLDIALCEFEGNGTQTRMKLREFVTMPYDETFKREVKAVFSKREVDLERVCLLNAYIGRFHADLINKSLQTWGVESADVDVIASHGQTIYHAPASLHGVAGMPDATLQIGDGDHIAMGTGIITLSDFRQKHVAAGGEGAPLAVYGDYLLFSEQDQNRIMLNIGGIANFTFLPGDLDTSRIFSTDVGPGNTLMDAYVQQQFPGTYYDADSAIALKGTYNQALVASLLYHPFFEQDFPKTTGPELFNLSYLAEAQRRSDTEHLSPEDVMASLNRFSAVAISGALTRSLGDSDFEIFLSGGGMHNPLLIQNIKALLPGATVRDTAELGVSPDAKEAVLFATLANECLVGEPIEFGPGKRRVPSVLMGKISLPE